MNEFLSFDLHPFNDSLDLKSKIKIVMEGKISRLHYELSGNLSVVNSLNPLKREDQRRRKSNLWETTCFEFFWSFGDQEYHELNVSSSGDWQIFSFSDYRNIYSDDGTDFSVIDLQTSKADEKFEMSLGLFSGGPMWERLVDFNPALIVDTGRLTCFSLLHGKDKADFHNRDLWKKIE